MSNPPKGWPLSWRARRTNVVPPWSARRRTELLRPDAPRNRLYTYRFASMTERHVIAVRMQQATRPNAPRASGKATSS